MEAKWRHVGLQNRAKIVPEAIFRKKLVLALGKTRIFKDLGVEVGSKNRSKIDQNLKSNIKCLLASIFHGFWWVLGSKLGGETEPRSIKNRSKKEVMMGRPLGIDFSWILVDFGGQDGAKLAGKIEPRTIKKTVENAMKKEGILEASWRRLGPSWGRLGPKRPLDVIGVGGCRYRPVCRTSI